MTKAEFQLMFYYERAKYPDIHTTARQPLAQAVLESANFTSHVYLTNNNCLGMTPPQARNTTCTNKGTKDKYANYLSPFDGVQDYILWLQAMGCTDDGKLDAFLSSGRYAKDPSYYKKIVAGVAELDKAGKYIDPAVLKAGTIAGALALAGAVAWGIVNALD